MLLKKTLKSV